MYPNLHGQDDNVSKIIAKLLNLPTLHTIVHHDDVFYCWYYRDGKLVDKYSSCPDHFGTVSATGTNRGQIGDK